MEQNLSVSHNNISGMCSDSFQKERNAANQTGPFFHPVFLNSCADHWQEHLSSWQRYHSQFPLTAHDSGISETCQQDKHGGSKLQFCVMLPVTQVYGKVTCPTENHDSPYSESSGVLAIVDQFSPLNLFSGN